MRRKVRPKAKRYGPSRMLGCTFRLCEWLDQLAFLAHALSLGLERLRLDAKRLRDPLPPGSKRDGDVLAQLIGGFPHLEGIQRGFSPDRLIEGDGEGQRQALNQLLLYEVCAAFERWTAEMAVLMVLPESTLRDLKKNFRGRKVESALQFPESAAVILSGLVKVAPKDQPPGLKPLLKIFKKSIARAKGGQAARYPIPVRFRLLLLGHLQIYRAHKELRNCLVHSDLKVSKSFAEARAVLDEIRPSDMGLKELPRLVPMKEGDSATVSLRGVFGLMQIVRRVALIFDGYAN